MTKGGKQLYMVMELLRASIFGVDLDPQKSLTCIYYLGNRTGT